MAPKKSASAKIAAHPAYKEMVVKALIGLKTDRKDVSRQSIKKYIKDTYSHLPANVDGHVNNAIKKGVASGVLELPKGPSGPVRLAKKPVAVKPVAVKKTVTKVKKTKVAKVAKTPKVAKVAKVGKVAKAGKPKKTVKKAKKTGAKIAAKKAAVKKTTKKVGKKVGKKVAKK